MSVSAILWHVTLVDRHVLVSLTDTAHSQYQTNISHVHGAVTSCRRATAIYIGDEIGERSSHVTRDWQLAATPLLRLAEQSRDVIIS